MTISKTSVIKTFFSTAKTGTEKAKCRNNVHILFEVYCSYLWINNVLFLVEAQIAPRTAFCAEVTSSLRFYSEIVNLRLILQ